MWREANIFIYLRLWWWHIWSYVFSIIYSGAEMKFSRSVSVRVYNVYWTARVTRVYWQNQNVYSRIKYRIPLKRPRRSKCQANKKKISIFFLVNLHCGSWSMRKRQTTMSWWSCILSRQATTDKMFSFPCRILTFHLADRAILEVLVVHWWLVPKRPRGRDERSEQCVAFFFSEWNMNVVDVTYEWE